MARKFFTEEEFRAFASLLGGEASAAALDQKLSPLADSGPAGGIASVEAYGAKGDGRANDSAAVAAAIAAIGNNGTIVFGKGNYVIQNVTKPAGVLLQGAGRDATVISLPSTATTTSDLCFLIPDSTSLAESVIGEMTVNGSVISPRLLERRRDLLINSAPNTLSDTIYHWRHYAASGATYLGRDDFYVPFGTNLYAQFSFNQYTSTSVRTFGTTNECRAGLFTAVANSTYCTLVGSWSDLTDATCFVPGTPDTGGGNFKSATSNTATATFSGSNMTGNALCLIIAATNSNGYAIVEVDGDQTGSATGANLLPTVQASQTVSGGGLFLDSDLGKTYIDFYAESFIGDEHVPIAENLDEDKQHSLKIYVRGTKGTSASSNVSVRIVGAVACRRDSLPTDANSRMVRMRKINDSHLSLSACTAVIGWSADTNSANQRFVGENHVGTDAGVAVAEAAVSLTITDAAGSTITPTAGTYATSTAFDIKRVTTLSYAGTIFAQKTVTYRFRPNTPMQLTATGRINFIIDGYVHTALIGMLPALQMRNRYSTTTEKTDFDRALLGDRLIPDLTWSSGGSLEYKAKDIDTIAYFSTTHDTVYLMHCPRPDITLNNYKYSYPDYSYVRAVANVVSTTPPGGLKSYFTRVGQTSLGATPEPAPAGTVYEFNVGWRVMRVKRAAEVLQMRP